MASHVIVTDAAARRAKIAVSPAKFMADVLEEACKKLGVKDFDTSNYGLKSNAKHVDLSVPFRQTGLPPGAKLELVLLSKSPTVVTICLRAADPGAAKIPPAGLEEKFKSSTTLWQVLRVFESGGSANLNFTARGVAQTDSGSSGAGQIYYETPVVNLMGRELATFQDLQRTLAQLGMSSGRFMLRLAFRKTDKTLAEAMETIQDFFQPVDGPRPAEKLENIPPQTADSPMPDAPADPTPPPTDAPSEPADDPSHRPITVYSAPTTSTPQAALTSDTDADYEPTVAHARQYQARLKANSHNTRLPSDAEAAAAAAAKAAKAAAVTAATIRVKFPDASIVQFDVGPADSAADVYAQVRRVLADDSAAFLLKYTTPKGALAPVPQTTDVRVLRDLGFARGIMLHFLWADVRAAPAAPVLKPAFAQAATKLAVPTFEGVEVAEGEVLKPEEKKPAGGLTKGKVPKWFQGFKK